MAVGEVPRFHLKGKLMIIPHASHKTRALKLAGALTCLSALAAWSQPTPAPTTGDLPCKEEADVNPNDVPDATPDANGWYSMFNGTSFKGWFQSCKTGHSGGSTVGAIFRVGQVDGKGAIYTTQRGTSTGGIMMTNKKFKNYEIRFQTWPSFGNDAGVFNRTPMNGRCYQTTLDYIGGAAMGGVWGEGGFVGRDFRPFSMNGGEAAISIPGNGNGELSNWTTITKKIKATTQSSVPCPATGCTQTDWNLLWDKDGWNDIRISFYGGSAAGTGTIHMKSWFKKPTSTVWVPIIQDTTLNVIAPDGRIGLQVHGGGRFAGPKGTWYRNLKYRELTNTGKSITPVAKTSAESGELEDTEVQPMGLEAAEAPARFMANANSLSGTMDQDYSAVVSDAKGKVVESFSGKAGRIDHAFATDARGLLILRISTARGAQSHRLVRPF